MVLLYGTSGSGRSSSKRNIQSRSSARSFIVLLLIALIQVTSPIYRLSADEPPDVPDVYVAPVENATGVAGLDAAAHAVSRTLELTLAFLDELEAVPTAELPQDVRGRMPAEVTDEQSAERVAETADVDNVLFGVLDLDDDNRFQVGLSVYAHAEEEVTHTHMETVGSQLEVFDASDRAVAELVGAFGDVTIEFGSIALDLEGPADRDWTVWIDGETAGENVERVDRLLAGERHLELEVHGQTGSGLVASERIMIEADDTTTVSVVFPEVLPVGEEHRIALRREAERSLVQPIDFAAASEPIEDLETLVAAYPRDMQADAEFLEIFDIRSHFASLMLRLEDYAGYALAREGFVERELFAVAQEAESAVTELIAERGEQAFDAVNEDVHRLFDTLDALYRIEIADALYRDADDPQRAAELYEELYDVRTIAREYGVPGGRAAYYSLVAEDLAKAETLEEVHARRRPLRHLVIGGSGAGLALLSGASMLWGPIAGLQADVAEAEEGYDLAITPSEQAQYREELEELTPRVRAWRIAQWSAIGTGVGAIAYAAVARFLSTREIDQYREHIIDERLATEAAIAERIRAGERGTLLVRGLPPREAPQFQVGDRLATNMVLLSDDESPQTVSAPVFGSEADSFELEPEGMPPVIALDRRE